jgi:hypothetical protein
MTRNLTPYDDFSQLRKLVEAMPLSEALAVVLAEQHAADGLWRFFSNQYPNGGVAKWNEASSWKSNWEIHSQQFSAFGEDMFGNQLVIQTCSVNTFLWNHENGELVDLLLDPVTLIETVCQSGIDWIDFYNDGSLKVAREKLLDVPLECHLHWTTPLILGGQVNIGNTSTVERAMHLRGHAKLWKQVAGVAPGTSVIIKKT